MLSAMSPDEQFDEISGCKRALEAVLDRPVTTFAFIRMAVAPRTAA